jgi:hypothetical protein
LFGHASAAALGDVLSALLRVGRRHPVTGASPPALRVAVRVVVAMSIMYPINSAWCREFLTLLFVAIGTPESPYASGTELGGYVGGRQGKNRDCSESAMGKSEGW